MIKETLNILKFAKRKNINDKQNIENIKNTVHIIEVIN